MNIRENTENQKFLEVQKCKERLSIALKAANICVFEVDLAKQLYTFENAESIFGVSGGHILNDIKPLNELSQDEYQKEISAYFSHPDDHAVIAQAFNCAFNGTPSSYQARLKAGDSHFVWCKVDITPIIVNDKPTKIIGVITDISKIKARTDSLEQKVKLDHFTGLYNKKYAAQLIQDILKRLPNKKHALIILDIDNFKHFNDTNGHAVGDEVLQAMAYLLKQAFKPTDVISRFGGDEFVLFAVDIPNREWLSCKLERIVCCRLDPHTCTNSLGIALFPSDASDFDSLFEKADTALYQSKIPKATCTFFEDMNDEIK